MVDIAGLCKIKDALKYLVFLSTVRSTEHINALQPAWMLGFSLHSALKILVSVVRFRPRPPSLKAHPCDGFFLGTYAGIAQFFDRDLAQGKALSQLQN